MKKLPTLKTPRLILRPYKMEDAEEIALLANDKAIATNTENLPYPYETYMAEDWIRTHPDYFAHDKMLTLAVVLRKKNTLMGAIGLDMNKKNDHAELGYWLGRPFWGHGYATEAARRMLHFGFTDLKFHRVFSVHLSQNPTSGKVLQKLGMKHEGTLKEHVQKWGDYLDLEHYGILRQDYKP